MVGGSDADPGAVEGLGTGFNSSNNLDMAHTQKIGLNIELPIYRWA